MYELLDEESGDLERKVIFKVKQFFMDLRTDLDVIMDDWKHDYPHRYWDDIPLWKLEYEKKKATESFIEELKEHFMEELKDYLVA